MATLPLHNQSRCRPPGLYPPTLLQTWGAGAGGWSGWWGGEGGGGGVGGGVAEVAVGFSERKQTLSKGAENLVNSAVTENP